MHYKDYYKILKIERDADAGTIKQAYRRLARQYHPDVSSETDAETRFKEVAEAYEVLKDPEKRTAYDQLGMDRRGGGEFEVPPQWRSSHSFHSADTGDFSQFFESLFGSARGAGQSWHDIPGADQQFEVYLELTEAYQGTERIIRLASEHGTRAHGGNQSRQFKVKIPAGITEGQKIRVAGQGHPGSGGRRGDLFLVARFRPHPYFRVEGCDVHLRLPVSPWEAALGAKVRVPTLDGDVNMNIPPGTASGQCLRLGGRGLGKGHQGKQYVTIEIQTPVASTPAQRAIYSKMADTFEFEPRAGFFDQTVES